jgi:hypothetical protein
MAATPGPARDGYTDDQIQAAISDVLAAGNDMQLAASLIRLLAVQAPEKAQAYIDAVDVARLLAASGDL